MLSWWCKGGGGGDRRGYGAWLGISGEGELEFGCKKIEGVPKMNSSDPSLLPWEPKVFNLESGQHPDVTLAPLKSLAECLDAQQGCKKIKGIPNMSSSDPLLLPLEPGVKDER